MRAFLLCAVICAVNAFSVTPTVAIAKRAAVVSENAVYMAAKAPVKKVAKKAGVRKGVAEPVRGKVVPTKKAPAKKAPVRKVVKPAAKKVVSRTAKKPVP